MISLNPRLRIVCARCDGKPMHYPSGIGRAICPDCGHTGRDAEAEARLAYLAERLPEMITWLTLPGYNLMARDASDLHDLLTDDA